MKLDFVNASIGYAIDASDVYKTVDGGLSWTAFSIPVSYFPAIYFLNKDTGFVSGNEVYYKTSDGGASWQTLTMPTTTIFADYFFTNDSVGFATNIDYYYEHEILKTTDCGETWTGINQEPESHLYCIWFANNDTGYVGGYYDFGQTYSQIFQTIDGGVTWTEVWEGYFSDNPFIDIRFKSNHIEGYAIANDGRNVVATDGIGYWNTNWGDIFDTDTLGLPKTSYNYGNALDGFDHMYLFGKYGTVLKWGKDTAQWKEMSGRLVSDVNDLSFISSTNGWMTTGGTGILRTTDGGNTWHKTNGPRFYVSNIDAVNDSLVFAFGNYNSYFQPPVYRSTDAGQTWNSITVFPSAKLSELQMIDESPGYIISNGNGSPATVYKTTNGGLTWNPHSVGIGFDSEDRWTMFFLNANEGWVVYNGGSFGSANFLYHSTDGGFTWSNIYQYIGSSYDFQTVFFLNSQHGYLATNGTNYYETTDGGNTWASKNIPGATNYLKIFFSNSQNGWCLTMYDIYQTTDGGTIWSSAYQSETELYDIEYAQGSIFTRGFYGFLVRGSIPAPCAASFTLTPDSVIEGLYYGYNLSSGYDLTYTWDWGHSTTTVGQFPTHTYADSGWYNICLSIYDNYNGCTDTFCLNFYILKLDGEMGIHQIIIVPGAVPTPPVASDQSLEVNISPNPFSTSTTIQFNLNEASNVSIKLFSMEGKEVKTICNENFTEGDHQSELDRKEIAAGIYFLQFKMNDQVVMKKMVIQ
ncbi:MAG: T9SS type A sorting domain-containing protein [Chitinophagales bacterium]|nr:T9SS type A sorting domain-containing protein [Chitinophagales bacterium]